MHEFSHWNWIELKISIGEIALCAVTAVSAWYVSSLLARHQTADRALKDLTTYLCRETLTMLSELSLSIDGIQGSPNDAGFILGPEMFTKTQRLSNSLHSIEIAVSEGSLAKSEKVKAAAKDAKRELEPLIGHIQDAIVAKIKIDPVQFRQIEGHIRIFREAIIRIQIALV
ncbi:MAG: hypothetical protein WBY44_29470 [Bryobacteraceae bacterium]